MEFRKAEKRKAKLRLAITGPAGSGKTYGALLVAKGLGGKIVLLDTENGSGDLYAGICDYDVGAIQAPYTVDKYIDGIHQAEQYGYDIIIIDSLSHAWSGEGGLLDMQGKIADSSKSGNSYVAWRQVTPLHNKLIETMLNSHCHIIATMRSKTEYIQTENDYGKKEIRKVGMAPVQREGMDYEFGVVFDLNINHMASISKDRTSLFDGQVFKLSPEIGVTLKNWLETGIDPKERRTQLKQLWDRYLEVCNGQRDHAMNAMAKITGKSSSSLYSQDDIQLLFADVVRREEEASIEVQEQEQTQQEEINNDNQ